MARLCLAVVIVLTVGLRLSWYFNMCSGELVVSLSLFNRIVSVLATLCINLCFFLGFVSARNFRFSCFTATLLYGDVIDASA